MLFFILILLLINDIKRTEETNSAPTLKSHRKKPYAAFVFTNSQNLSPSDKKPCHWLARLKYQSNICWQRTGLPEVLLKARILSIDHCQERFKFAQWNCSKREIFFKKMYRETAFMYAISSSAVVYQTAKACSAGTLQGCQCGEHGKPSTSSEWQWGGCADNIKYAKKFSRKFLQVRKKDVSLNAMAVHNTELGIKVVMNNYKKDCKCHGVSASCTFQICWKRILPFDIISQQLKTLYHNAVQVQQKNRVQSFKGRKKGRKLLFIENDIDFCPMTINRQCNSTENCATLCCGRGTYEDYQIKVKQCKCRWRDNLSSPNPVQCDECTQNHTILRCV